MKTFLTSLVLLFLTIPFPAFAEVSLAERLSGKILLQVESYGRAWYVDPSTKRRYYLKNGKAAYEIMSSLGLGISNNDLEKIATENQRSKDPALSNRLKGRILLQVEERGEAWYVDPETGIRHYMKDGDAAYTLMRNFSLGISNENLQAIPVNTSQIIPDTAFGTVAYSGLVNGDRVTGEYDDTILPLASLTKLMTAITLLDFGIDLDKKITISESVIKYPKRYVGEDPTSEIELEQGDTLSVYDLWVSMLLASSNQAAAALAEQTGLTVDEFVVRMNQKAVILGLKKTLFFDVAGLDAHNVATAHEMAKMADFAFSDPLIAELSVLENYSVKITSINGTRKVISIPNRNISLMKYSPDGVKTGYLVEAERNVAIKKGNKIIVVLHALSMKQRNDIVEMFL